MDMDSNDQLHVCGIWSGEQSVSSYRHTRDEPVVVKEAVQRFFVWRRRPVRRHILVVRRSRECVEEGLQPIVDVATGSNDSPRLLGPQHKNVEVGVEMPLWMNDRAELVVCNGPSVATSGPSLPVELFERLMFPQLFELGMERAPDLMLLIWPAVGGQRPVVGQREIHRRTVAVVSRLRRGRRPGCVPQTALFRKETVSPRHPVDLA
jgi:hypothetical protein